MEVGRRPCENDECDPITRRRDLAAALNRGAPLRETTYRAVLKAFGEQALAEIVFLVGCFSMVGITLNAFDASVPGREEHLD